MADGPGVRDLVGAIADGDAIEWGAAEAVARTPAERDLLFRLKAISTAAVRRRPVDTWAALVEAQPKRLVYRAIVLAAALKILVAFGTGWFLLAATRVPSELVWPRVVNLAVFGVAGAALAVGGRRDPRSRRLGMFFVVTASAFADRVLLQVLGTDAIALAITAITRFPTDAFLAYALWLFVWEFPSAPRRRSDRRVTEYFLRIAAGVGTVLFIAGMVPWLETWGVSMPRLARTAAALDRHTPASSYYWPVLFAAVAPALPYLLWKARFGAAEERRRVATFVISFVAGLTPMTLAVIVSPYVAFFDNPANRSGIGLFLYGSLLSIVPMTAYTVVVNRVMDIELLITAAMRHRAIRYGVWLAGLAPLGAMAGYTYANRHMTVTQLLSARGALVLLPLAGVTALTFRNQILRAIDRRFVGEHPDYLQVLAYLERSLREAQGVRQVLDLLAREVERALHARTEVLVLDETGSALISPTNAVGPLRMDSTLGSLVRLAREEIYVGVEPSGPVQRLLPEADRQWLTGHEFQILVPLAASGGDVLGLIALGAKRSMVDYLAEDRLLLTMMASHGATYLENRSLRDLPYRYLIHPSGRTWSHVDWDDEPGALCTQCRTMWPARRLVCECGARTDAAALPVLFRGKFRVERLIGAGGMSVVYLATDIALNRRVAIKTLPSLTPDRVARLEREAQAMASVMHPNLALIFGIESWRGAPLLVVEYLERGTLADWLATERTSVRDTIELGIVLADVLDQMHAVDVLHRDVKPSNIGYARDGSPKLMDFGVARMVPLALQAAAVAELLPVEEPGLALPVQVAVGRTSPDHVIGTPLYLSPEAIAGAEADCTFDLWSLSLTLYEALTGHNPFRAETVGAVFERIRRGEVPDVRTMVPDCPERLARFFAAALARNPGRRPQTAADLRNRLRLIRDAPRLN